MAFRASGLWIGDGNRTTYVNNIHGLPTTINEAVGTNVARTTTIVYDMTWTHLPASIATPGLTAGFMYDAHGEQLTKTLTDTTTNTSPYPTKGQTRTWTNTWANALLASVQSPKGNTTQYGYDSTGALTSVTDALSHIMKITAHTGGGLPQTIVDPNGVTTALTYSPRQWLTSSTISGTGGTFVTSWAYDGAGDLATTTLPDNSYLGNTYDAAHRLTKVTDALGNYTSYMLDALGDRTQTSVYKSGGILTWQASGTFDALGRELIATAGAGQTTRRTFDAVGNALTVQDGLAHTTTTIFDALNRPSAITDASNGVTTPAYDTHDRLVSVTDANGNKTSYIRDGFEGVIQQTSPDSGTSVFHYDADANPTSKTDALGIVANQTFDALDRPLTTTYPADPAENIAYTYDQTGPGLSFGIGRLTSVTDAAGSLTKNYEERGNLASERRVNGTTTLNTGYTYDGANRIASMTYPDGTLVTYLHDAAGYASSVTAKLPGASAATTLATLTHQPFGPMNGVAYGNGIAESWTFDQSYRPTNIADLLSAANVQNLTYGYDLADNVKSITDAVNGANSQTLGYDVINRLTSATSGAGGYGAFAWSYDKVGNRQTQVLNGVTITYGYTAGTNRLATISGTGIIGMLGAPSLNLSSGHQVTLASVTLNPGRLLYHAIAALPVSPSRTAASAGIYGWPILLSGLAGIVAIRKRWRGNRLFSLFVLGVFTAGLVTLLLGPINSIHASSVQRGPNNPTFGCDCAYSQRSHRNVYHPTNGDHHRFDSQRGYLHQHYTDHHFKLCQLHCANRGFDFRDPHRYRRAVRIQLQHCDNRDLYHHTCDRCDADILHPWWHLYRPPDGCYQ